MTFFLLTLFLLRASTAEALATLPSSGCCGWLRIVGSKAKMSPRPPTVRAIIRYPTTTQTTADHTAANPTGYIDGESGDSGENSASATDPEGALKVTSPRYHHGDSGGSGEHGAVTAGPADTLGSSAIRGEQLLLNLGIIMDSESRYSDDGFWESLLPEKNGYDDHAQKRYVTDKIKTGNFFYDELWAATEAHISAAHPPIKRFVELGAGANLGRVACSEPLFNVDRLATDILPLPLENLRRVAERCRLSHPSRPDMTKLWVRGKCDNDGRDCISQGRVKGAENLVPGQKRSFSRVDVVYGQRITCACEETTGFCGGIPGASPNEPDYMNPDGMTGFFEKVFALLRPGGIALFPCWSRQDNKLSDDAQEIVSQSLRALVAKYHLTSEMWYDADHHGPTCSHMEARYGIFPMESFRMLWEMFCKDRLKSTRIGIWHLTAFVKPLVEAGGRGVHGDDLDAEAHDEYYTPDTSPPPSSDGNDSD